MQVITLISTGVPEAAGGSGLDAPTDSEAFAVVMAALWAPPPVPPEPGHPPDGAQTEAAPAPGPGGAGDSAREPAAFPAEAAAGAGGGHGSGGNRPTGRAALGAGAAGSAPGGFVEAAAGERPSPATGPPPGPGAAPPSARPEDGRPGAPVPPPAAPQAFSHASARSVLLRPEETAAAPTFPVPGAESAPPAGSGSGRAAPAPLGLELTRTGDPHPAGPPAAVPATPPTVPAPPAAAPTPSPGLASTSPPPGPVDQLVSVLEPLRSAPQGRSEVTLELRPAGLGTVRVEVTVERGVVHLHLHADRSGTAELVRQSVADLRAALETAGLSAGSLSVDSGGSGGRHGPTGGFGDPDTTPGLSDRPARGRPAEPAGAVAAPGREGSVQGGLDLLL